MPPDQGRPNRGLTPAVLVLFLFAVGVSLGFAAFGWSELDGFDGKLEKKADKTAIAAKEGKDTAQRNTRTIVKQGKQLTVVQRQTRIIQGTIGERGPFGLRGPEGGVGPEGQPGATGLATEGATGAPGAAGKDGVDGSPGKDGADGKDGVDGVPGADATDAQVVAAVEAFLLAHTQTCEPTADLLDDPQRQTCTIDP